MGEAQESAAVPAQMSRRRDYRCRSTFWAAPALLQCKPTKRLLPRIVLPWPSFSSVLPDVQNVLENLLAKPREKQGKISLSDADCTKCRVDLRGSIGAGAVFDDDSFFGEFASTDSAHVPIACGELPKETAVAGRHDSLAIH